MYKKERLELARAGFYVLRAQLDSRKSVWKIVKHTRGGGWARFGANWYTTRTEANNKIDQLESAFPSMYKKDENN